MNVEQRISEEPVERRVSVRELLARVVTQSNRDGDTFIYDDGVVSYYDDDLTIERVFTLGNESVTIVEINLWVRVKGRPEGADIVIREPPLQRLVAGDA